MQACICPGGKCKSSKFLLRRRFWLALAVVGKIDLKAGKNSKKLGGPSLLIETIVPPTKVKSVITYPVDMLKPNPVT